MAVGEDPARRPLDGGGDRMLTVPSPEPGEPALRPAAPMTSIQHFEAPSDEIAAPGAPDQAGEAEPMPDQRAAEPARASDDDRNRPAARGSARVRPAAPEGAERPARTDIQTTSGVPKKPIPAAQPAEERPSAEAPAKDPAAPAEPAAPKTSEADEPAGERPTSSSAADKSAGERQTSAAGEPTVEVAATESADADDEPTALLETDTKGQEDADPQPQVEGEGAKPEPQVEGENDPEKTVVIKLPDHDPEKTVVLTMPPSSVDDTVVLPIPAKPTPEATPRPTEPTPTKPTPAQPIPAKPRPAQPGPAAKPRPAQPNPAKPRPAQPNPAKPRPVQPNPAGASPAKPRPAEAKPARDPGDDTVVIVPPAADDTMVLPVGTVAPPTEVVTAIIPVVPGRKAGAPGAKEFKPRQATSAEAAPADPGRAPKPARPRRELLDLGHAPAVLTISALGVLMVALAYAGGRVSTGNAPYAYWLGQVVVFTPVVVRLLSRRMAGAAESFLLVMGLALNQYLLKWMYSPDQFRFPDELQHWLATTIIVESGKLFQPNPALPPAVHFPGLAEMGAAVSSMTGLPVTAAGVIVAGVAHLVFVSVLFAAVLRASNSPAVAGVCCATYATALHYLFFNSMFLYQTAALPFFMLTIWATRRWRAEGGWPFVTLAVCAAALTTVSHHVTAFALVITLLLLAVVELAVQRPRQWKALVMPAVALVVVAVWMLTVARDVLGYLEAPVEQVGQTISNLINGRSEASSTTAAVSVGQLVVQGSGLLGLFVLYAALVRDMIHRRDRDSWRWAAVIGGAVFFAGNGVRFLGQNGPEIAGRLSTFTYVPISILAAIALVRGVQIIPAKDAEGRRWRWRAAAPAIDVVVPGGWNLYSRVAAGSAMITLLMIGARAGGWPPLGSILPGPYLAGGFERSVDVYGVDTAEWERRTLGHGNRIGGDVTSVSLASTYGRQDPVREVGPLYYADDWGLDEEQFVSDLAIQYLVVDKRLSEQLPEGEAYFENDPNAGSITRPLTTTQIAKFDSLTDVDRLYDNGTVRVYRLGAQ
ncbi:hypothetical protein AB0J80_26610 [Actinoplanes sp. NPDC049548]|uniref:hypothetical protein n=1 Tax=Actinoplanes sp. NPDC049548 TaxID=3155152 RepID=UPI0034360709